MRCAFVLMALFMALALTGCSDDSGDDNSGKEYSLAVEITPSVGGTVHLSSDGEEQSSQGDAVYASGTKVTLTAEPAYGYMFVGWSMDASTSDTTITILMDRDKIVYATFALDIRSPEDESIVVNDTSWKIKRHTIETDAFPAEGGTVTRIPDDTVYFPGAKVIVMARAAEGYEFIGWSGTLWEVSKDSTVVTITIDSTSANAMYISAMFAPIADTSVVDTIPVDTTAYALTTSILPVASGTVTRFPDLEKYTPESEVLVIATAAAGYVFVGWLGDDTSSVPSVTVVMDTARTLTANFVPIYTLTVNEDPIDGGVVSRDTNNVFYVAGTQVTLTVTADEEYAFAGWVDAAKDTVSKDTALTVTMNSDTVLTAAFARTYVIAADASPMAGGTVSKSPEQDRYVAGTQVTLSATAARGYKFTGWQDTEGTLISTDSSYQITVTDSRMLIAVFVFAAVEPDPDDGGYALVTPVIPEDCGVVMRSLDMERYPTGTQITLTAYMTPGSGCEFRRWVDKDGETASAVNVVSVTAGAGTPVMVAEFSRTEYTLTTGVIPVFLESCGTVTRTPDRYSYAEGTEVTLTAEAGAGCEFVRWVDTDLNMVSEESALLLTMDDDTKIIAEFKGVK